MPGLVNMPPPWPKAAPRPGAWGVADEAEEVGGAWDPWGAQGLGAGVVVSVEGVGAGAAAWPLKSWFGNGHATTMFFEKHLC